MPAYNGHKNWTHWNVSLWIFNDESLYTLANKVTHSWDNKDDAAWHLLQILNDSGVTHTPDGALYSVTSIRAALGTI